MLFRTYRGFRAPFATKSLQSTAARILLLSTAATMLLLSVVGCDSSSSEADQLRSPILVEPRDGSTDNPDALILEWDSRVGASTYRVQVAKDNGFTDLVLDEPASTSTSLVSTGLEMGVRYYWRVQAIGPLGESAWSSVSTFVASSVAVVPAPPSLSFPENEANNQPTTVELGWLSAEGALAYDIQMSMEPGMARLVADLRVRGTHKDIRELVNGYTYYWRVRAVSAIGESGWSDIRMFVCSLESRM